MCKIASGQLLYGYRELKLELCDNLEGWDGVGDVGEAQEGGAICVCVADSLGVSQKPTQHCKAIILQFKKSLMTWQKLDTSSIGDSFQRFQSENSNIERHLGSDDLSSEVSTCLCPLYFKCLSFPGAWGSHISYHSTEQSSCPYFN